MARLTHHNDGRVSNGPKGIPHMPGWFCEKFRCKDCVDQGKDGMLVVRVIEGNPRIRCVNCDSEQPNVVHIASLEHERNRRLLEGEDLAPVVAGGEPIFHAYEEEHWL